jgi:oligosaccharide repeat unit polymerase
MLPLFLILILSLFVFYSIRFMMKKGHDLHAYAFFTLYIYTIFAQIGYAYFPELSDLAGAYFGPMLFYKYWAFMFFSFVFTFLLYRVMNPKNDKKDVYIVKATSRNYGEYFFFLIVILLYLTLSQYFDTYRGIFGYGGGTPMGGPWFGIGFWMFTLCTLILFTLVRDKSNKIKKRIFSFVLFIICTLFFIEVAIASGVRSTILYFFLSLAFYELFPIIKTIKFQKRKIFTIIVSGVIVISLLTTLRTLRNQGEDISFSSFLNYESSETQFSDQALSAAILTQDYYLPSHTLFISMHYNIIDPLEVVKSNFANSLIKLKYPYLSTMIVEQATGHRDDRGAGWGYHYFVEGYNAIGLPGVFYNALFWNLAMILWIRLTQSNNRRHNKAMLSILVLVIVLVMRSQTSAFIQFYWLILLPGLALLLLANNSTIAFYRRR